MAFPCGGSSSTASRSNWNLEVLIFVEGGKPENPEKNPRSRVENQQQTRVTAVGGECSHPSGGGGGVEVSSRSNCNFKVLE